MLSFRGKAGVGEKTGAIENSQSIWSSTRGRAARTPPISDGATSRRSNLAIIQPWRDIKSKRRCSCVNGNETREIVASAGICASVNWTEDFFALALRARGRAVEPVWCGRSSLADRRGGRDRRAGAATGHGHVPACRSPACRGGAGDDPAPLRVAGFRLSQAELWVELRSPLPHSQVAIPGDRSAIARRFCICGESLSPRVEFPETTSPNVS